MNRYLPEDLPTVILETLLHQRVRAETFCGSRVSFETALNRPFPNWDSATVRSSLAALDRQFLIRRIDASRRSLPNTLLGPGDYWIEITKIGAGYSLGVSNRTVEDFINVRPPVDEDASSPTLRLEGLNEQRLFDVVAPLKHTGFVSRMEKRRVRTSRIRYWMPIGPAFSVSVFGAFSWTELHNRHLDRVVGFWRAVNAN